jgi:hypothetical protein
MIEEIQIDFIPEDTGAPYEAEDTFIEVPQHVADKICKAKYGHTNWVRMDRALPADLTANPHIFDYERGIIYFKNSNLI